MGIAGPAHFLVDTGADTTTLHLRDRRDLGIALNQLSPQRFLVSGVGGLIEYAKEPASVRIFDRDAASWRYFALMLDIYTPERSPPSPHRPC